MPEPKARRGRFWRYNYKVLVGTGYWVLAVPVAASQIVTLWMFSLSSDFGQLSATRIAELMTPILAAFLVAHSLGPEYRSGVGAVLASKPLSLGKVLGMRAGLGMLAALALTLITLSVCNLGLKPIDVWTPVLACLPSVWFYSALALVFATIFRNPTGGFAVTLGVWAVDFSLGYGVHPFLSVQGLGAALEADSLAGFWIPGKVVQFAVGAVLWWVHARLLPRVCRPPERTDVLKIAGASVGVAALYCATGAATLVAYAYSQRANLPQADALWLHSRLQVYGPVPVARLFGPAFEAYAFPPATSASASKTARLDQLQRAASHWPHSIWADGIAYTLAVEREADRTPATLGDVVSGYLAVADRFSGSPFAPKALSALLRLNDPGVSPESRLLAARRLLADYPHSRETERAADALSQYYPDRVKAEEMLKAAGIARDAAPLYRKPEWLVRRAEVEADLDRTSDAMQDARQAATEAAQVQALARSSPQHTTELSPFLGNLASTVTRSQQLQARLNELR